MHKLVQNWSRFSKEPKVRRRRSTKCANVSTGEMAGTEMGAKSFGPSLTTCSVHCVLEQRYHHPINLGSILGKLKSAQSDNQKFAKNQMLSFLWFDYD